jgi:hypothetical protein
MGRLLSHPVAVRSEHVPREAVSEALQNQAAFSIGFQQRRRSRVVEAEHRLFGLRNPSRECEFD